jgi:Mn2+/Fe2+ NRAMP family transporter
MATYARAGATFGHGMLWAVPFTLPLQTAVQEICDRTALATGKSLGALARMKFGTKARAVMVVLQVALVGANTLNLSADLMAIGQGMQLLHAGPAPLWADVVRGLTAQQFRLTPAYLSLIVAVLGTTISPYLFFWQSAHRIEELRAHDASSATAASTS